MLKINQGELSTCENEPLAWSGQIQKNGVLLVFDENQQLSHFSTNIGDYFDIDPFRELAISIQELFLDETANFPLRQHDIYNGSHYFIRGVLTNKSIEGNVLLSENNGRQYFEFEPVNSQAMQAYHSKQVEVQQSAAMFLPAEDISSLLREIHHISGFHKIMVYRFLDDDAGEVIAELSDKRLDSYLGLRFPATDIPRIARNLYIDNPFRLIFNVLGDNVPIIARPGNAPEIDLSYSTLRSVSPVHLEYLSNMKVQSSVSFSIRVMGKLWGLVALHSIEPLTIEVPERVAIRQLVDRYLATPVMNQQIKTENKRFNSNTRVLEKFTNVLIEHYNSHDKVTELPEPLIEMIACDGLAIISGDQICFNSADISRDELFRIRDTAASLSESEQFATESLLGYMEQDKDFYHRASGLIYQQIHLGKSPAQTLELLWIRKEKTVSVDWAGKPEKIEHDEGGMVRISPRLSFEKWTALSEATAAPWQNTDLLLANRLAKQTINAAKQLI